ncbi:MAG: hypothetical protein KF752_06575 [Pirellulaceae bacterium]|nr:hypothetical protein [Pirellulaceae bacterium]
MDGKVVTAGARRAIVLDVIRCASKVPSFPVERSFQMFRLAEARHQCATRISWTALFARAYGLASRVHPQLRHVFVAWPWARIYQSPECVLSIAVNRQVDGGERLFFGRMRHPDQRCLTELQADLDAFQNGDPARVFRSQWRGAKLPSAVRRVCWWWRMDVDFRNRARRVGTGSISALAGQGVTNRLHPCLLTSSLSYGPIEADGHCLVTLQCDHRLLDGAAAARALNSIDQHLNGQVLNELLVIAGSQAPAARIKQRVA